jgi:phosphatidylserine decarboxylase precursor-related protein
MLLTIGIIVAVLIVLLVAGWLFAHRDPDRDIAPFDGYLSPADGIVIAIHEVKGDKQKIKKKAHGITAWLDDFPQGTTIVVIMMKFWHVHTQRAPADGVVQSTFHQDGTFANAVFGDYSKATVENEHAGMTFSGTRPSKVYLIAGLVARRITLAVKKNKKIKQGDRIGNIAFGSQVAIVLPKTKILVKKGQRVTAGVTKLAR